jgi:hypothetical protein
VAEFGPRGEGGVDGRPALGGFRRICHRFSLVW